jgi:hypothetical protein
VTTAVFPERSNKSMLSPAQNLSRGQRRRWPEAYATTAITLTAAGSGHNRDRWGRLLSEELLGRVDEQGPNRIGASARRRRSPAA